jgi:glycosyltransferase involved in cell wall biosynthesis
MTERSTPTVTVLMAVYNGERYVAQAVESILAQTYRDFEFVIVDDGSTDSSREMIERYSDPRIRLVSNSENTGLAAALNRGLTLSRGSLVARQDADDVSEPGRLARQVAYLKSHPDVAVVGSWYRKIDSEGQDLGLRRLACEPLDVRWAMLFHCPLIHSAVMFRRAPLIERGWEYDSSIKYGEDYALWSRVADELPISNIAEPLVRLRSNPWSMTATYGNYTLKGRAISIENIGRLLGWTRPPEGFARRHAAMEGLVLGGDPELAVDDLVAAVPDILMVNQAFARHERLPAVLAQGRESALRRHMAHRLLWLGRRRARTAAEACRIMAAVRQLNARALVSADTLRLAAAGTVRALCRR